MHSLTSNQFYRGLRHRFDRRAALLHRLGFAYTATEHGAVFTRQRFTRRQSIPAGTLHHACNRAWRDLLALLLTH